MEEWTEAEARGGEQQQLKQTDMKKCADLVWLIGAFSEDGLFWD